MAERNDMWRAVSEPERRRIEIARRLRPEDRLRVGFLMSEIARRIAVERVDRIFPGLLPMQRAWKIMAFSSEENGPALRLDNVAEYAARVEMSGEWERLRAELAIE